MGWWVKKIDPRPSGHMRDNAKASPSRENEGVSGAPLGQGASWRAEVGRVRKDRTFEAKRATLKRKTSAYDNLGRCGRLVKAASRRGWVGG